MAWFLDLARIGSGAETSTSRCLRTILEAKRREQVLVDSVGTGYCVEGDYTWRRNFFHVPLRRSLFLRCRFLREPDGVD